jgi:hypothetical protein
MSSDFIGLQAIKKLSEVLLLLDNLKIGQINFVTSYFGVKGRCIQP